MREERTTQAPASEQAIIDAARLLWLAVVLDALAEVLA